MSRVPLLLCLSACLTLSIPAARASTASLRIALVKRVPSLPSLPETASRASIEASLRVLDDVWRIAIDDAASSQAIATLRVTLIAR